MRGSIAALVAFFIADRLLKNVIWFSQPLQTPGAVFSIRPVLNEHIAFSLSVPFQQSIWFLIFLAVIILLIAWQAVRLYRAGDKIFFCWGLIAIGALSNLLDRLTLGGILDYIDLSWFPIFNISDVYIAVGIAVLIAAELFWRRRPKKVATS